MSGFGSVDLKVRPLRLGFLIDPNNKKQLEESMSTSSTLWSGTSFPIIPLYTRMPKTWADGPIKPPKSTKVILGYIEAFDPDVLVNFSDTTPDYISSLGLRIIKPEDIWETLDSDRYLSPKYGIGVFEIFKKIFDDHFKYKAKYPINVLLPEAPDKHKLFWSSFLGGELPEKISNLVKDYYDEPLEINRKPFVPSDINKLIKSNNLFPRRIVEHDLEHIRRSGGRRSAYAFFMDATKFEDIVDYWNLRATGRVVLPLPKQYLTEEYFIDFATNFFKQYRRPWGHNEKHCDCVSIVRSKNSTMVEMTDFVNSINLKPDPSDPSQDPYYSLQHWYPRMWDEWARDKDGIIPDDFYGEGKNIEIPEFDTLDIKFNPLIPKFADKHVFHGEPRCVNEVSFRFYGADQYLAEIFPKDSGENLLRSISPHSFQDLWRIGRHGLVKLITDTHTEHWTIPEAEKVVFAWLKDQGWEATPSTPGILAKQIYKKLDGHIFALSNKKLLPLLEYMNGGKAKINGGSSEEDDLQNGRQLPVEQIKENLKKENGQDSLLDYLIEKGVFHAGIKIKCPHCLRKSWFSIHKVDDNIQCPKCLNDYPAIGNIEKGSWCYKTTGPFSVPNHADGSYATLLALNFFNDHKLNTFKSTPALNFSAKADDGSGREMEADIALFWQDSIYGEKMDGILFAECKTYGEFKSKDFKRMKTLAKEFPGAVIAFTTLRNKLTDYEISEITKLTKIGRKFWKSERPINPILILTETELLGMHRPPYCWEDKDGERKYNHVRGLISVCNFTQQRYLGMKSWQDEWREEWEKKRKQIKPKKKRSVRKSVKKK